jgi:hypothetical protein
VGGVQVVVEDAPGGSAAFLVGVGGVGELGGVGAEQVVQGVPAGGVLVDQVGGDQPVEQQFRRLLGEGGEGGGGRQAHVGPGRDAE